MKSKIPTVIIIILAITVMGLAGYIFLGHHERGDFKYEDFRRPPFRSMQNFSLNDEMKNAVITFFDSSPTIEGVKAYCEQNKMNCFYYCREVNPQYENCNELIKYNSTNWRGNFSRGGQ